jgi:hypothetical protein
MVVIWGDDVGESNIGAYNFGLMGYQTPNIDRLAKEGMMFTDTHGDQSCTAGRSTFIALWDKPAGRLKSAVDRQQDADSSPPSSAVSATLSADSPRPPSPLHGAGHLDDRICLTVVWSSGRLPCQMP